jgi:hyperosmotically inducible protein
MANKDTADGSAELKQAVAGALRSEPGLQGYDIQVDAHRECIILQGVVDVLAEKRLAGQVARGVPGVEKVENAVTISTDGAITDDDVALEVAEELGAGPLTRRENVGVDVRGGTARLVGEVQSEEERVASAHAAARARGVHRVLNQIKRRDRS